MHPLAPRPHYHRHVGEVARYAPGGKDLFATFASAVEIVTPARGREIFDNSRALFRRLQELGAARVEIMALRWRGLTAAPESVAALNYLLTEVGLSPFFRAMRRRTEGAARAAQTIWQFEALLNDYLGFTWDR